MTVTVSTILSTDFHWDFHVLCTPLPSDIRAQIVVVPLSRANCISDRLVWGESSSGAYSSRSGYAFISQVPHPPDSSKCWKQLCQLPVPAKLKDCLLTNAFHFHRGIATSPMCARCTLFPETTLHLLRDCIWSRDVWTRLHAPNVDPSFFAASLDDWVAANVFALHATTTSMLRFLIGCWVIWCARNKAVINGESLSTGTQRLWHRSLMQDCLSIQHMKHVEIVACYGNNLEMCKV
ncbi:hypothetical protein K2173_028011 [Erythroxylum novogranatense]|uniref:Reverse transcriptase zinc-binding domain-containing protein n=1 Tax=Erythroxylum novogranatense TaxID=1862640 RepID=A0AAV8U3L5_9ROSI|nr:hypothetical protein K2173_028011 [Erythroxylum novogranatense]